MNFFKTHNIGTYGGPLVMLPKSDANMWQGCVDLKTRRALFFSLFSA